MLPKDIGFHDGQKRWSSRQSEQKKNLSPRSVSSNFKSEVQASLLSFSLAIYPSQVLYSGLQVKARAMMDSGDEESWVPINNLISTRRCRSGGVATVIRCLEQKQESSWPIATCMNETDVGCSRKTANGSYAAR